GDHDGGVSDLQVADPVHGGELDHGTAFTEGAAQDLLHDRAQLGLDGRMRRVTELRDTTSVVVVADGAQKDGGAPGPRVGDGVEDLVDRERGVTYGCESD